MGITQKEIARRLGISDSLVSRVLNDRPNTWATPELRARIHDTARELGYQPNPSAQALRTGKTGLIALWSTRLDLPYYTHYVALLQDMARADGYQTVVRPVDNSTADWNWPADGIICLDAPQSIIHYREKAGDSALPIVSLGVLSGTADDEVLVDLYTGAAEAMASLVEIGCRRVAYLLPQFALASIGDGRRRAYDEAMAAGDASPEYIVANDLSGAAAYGAIVSHAQARGNPDALFCFLGGEFAIGAVAAIVDLGARVPADVAVVATGDSSELSLVRPAISAVEMPSERAAAEAWRLLRIRRTRPHSPVQRTVLPSRFVSRASSTR